MDELKPCPFCGGEDIALVNIRPLKDLWGIWCIDCQASFPLFNTEQKAIKAWNRRCEHETD